jgi:hypothetical protein
VVARIAQARWCVDFEIDDACHAASLLLTRLVSLDIIRDPAVLDRSRVDWIQ